MSSSKIQDACHQIQSLSSQYTTFENQESTKEFADKINQIALSIISLEQKSSCSSAKKAEILAGDLARFHIMFTQDQFAVLQKSDHELLRQAAKILEIETLIDEHFPPNLPGCNVIIMNKGEVLANYSAGLADIETGQKSDINLQQHIGSVSKQFTAACIVDLEAKGLLQFDEDIHTYLPSLPPFTYQGKPVTLTIDNLLHMQSGLPEVLAFALISGKEEQNLTEAEKLAALFQGSNIELAFLSGTSGHYCNTNYYLLAEVVKVVAGEDLRTYAQKHIFNPHGMTNSHYIDPQGSEKQSIPGYAVVPQSKTVTDITTKNKTSGPCGVIAPSMDLVQWDANCPTEMWEKLTELPHDQELGPNRIYARGLWVEKVGEYKVSCHSGGIEGFQTEFLKLEHADPTHSFTVFLSSNNPFATNFGWLVGTVASIWAGKELFPPREAPTITEPPKVNYVQNKEELKKFEGKYNCPTLQAKYGIEAVRKEDRWFLKMKPVGSDEQFSFHFAPSDQDPNVLVHVKDNGEIGSATLQFSEGKLIFSDPDPAIKDLSLIKFA